ncbi:MAG TPA: VWA domain-containing protein [Candidatus Angelobacter sp.]|jgi:hypothetical protein
MKATKTLLAAFLGMLVLPVTASAAVTRTELAGNSLSEFPFFEYVKAFNANAPVKIAIDPTRFPSIAGKTCDIYVVNAKSASQWIADPSLTDVRPGGAQTQTFSGTNIQANTFQIAGPAVLNANAGTDLGVGYDVVLDCDQNGTLSDGDFLDGGRGEAGFYVVHDTTAAGPLAVTESVYSLDSGVAASFGIVATKLGEDLYFPTGIAAMGKRPLVVIGHGNGHDFTWYGHIGRHLASYGYVVVSIANDTGPGPDSAATTTLGHTDAFLDQAEAGAIAGGALVGHLDSHKIVWIGHSRGAEAVAISYNRLFTGAHTPVHFAKHDIRLISSMLPTDFGGTDDANPRDANYHLWTASGDADVNGSAGNECTDGIGHFFELCQTFHLVERATGYKQSTIVQGTGHGEFHDHPAAGDVFTGPCGIGRSTTHLIQLGYFLPLVKHYVDGNIPALDFLTRPYESFHPIGIPSDPCIFVSNEFRNGASVGNFIIDDYQTQPATGTSSSGGTVTFNVENLTEGRLDDNNLDFVWAAGDPFNGATQAGATDSLTTRHDDSSGVVFDWTDNDRFYEWQVPASNRNFSNFLFLSFRGAQGTRHPNTLASPGYLNFTITLRDGLGTTSSIRIAAYGGGLVQPYARDSGWHNEMRTIRIRATDFLNNNSGLNLSDVVAVRLNFGPSFGSSKGRIVLDDLMLTNDVTPFSLQIVEPTTAHSSYAGTSTEGNRVLVRVVAGGGLDVSPGNLTISVNGTALTSAQIPTAAAQVGGETWIVIAPGAKPPGCYDLAVSLTTPAGISAAQPQSLCYNDFDARALDRLLAVDQTNSMNWDGSTNLPSTAKMDAARAAAKFFVDLSNPNDQIGVISFQRRDQNRDGTIQEPDELSELRFPLTLAGEGGTDQRPAARNAIGLISPDTTPGFVGPETSIGAGLVRARTMLHTSGIAGHEPNIVLLTDGLENYPPFWSRSGPSGSPLRPVFVADNIRIDTVGLGGDADDVLLTDIATATGGQFRHLNEGSGSFFLLSRLAKWYKGVDEDVRGEQRFFYQEGFPPETAGGGDVIATAVRQGKIRIQHFSVEPALDWMTVAFHANIDNAATVKLYEPGSAVPIVVSPPGVTFRSDPKHAVYRIQHPKPGIWSYVVQPHDLSAEFFAIASAPTLLAARMGPNQLESSAGGFSMPLRVWIADKSAVLHATVNGYVREPNGVKVPVVLLDDGAHVDGAANDAIYGLNFGASQLGPYYVELKASGTSNSGEPFERYLSTTFVVPGQPKRPVQCGEGLACNPNGEPSPSSFKLLWFSAHLGHNFSLNGFGRDPALAVNNPANHTRFESGPSITFDVEKPFRTRYSIYGMIGYHYFDSPQPAIADQWLVNFSLNLRLYRPAGPWRWFAGVGPGIYHDNVGTTAMGFNTSLGLEFAIKSNFAFEAGADFHFVHPGGTSGRYFVDPKLGIKWHF